MRSLIARNSGVKDAKVGTQDGASADVLGVMAEYAFAKRYNTFPDLGLTPRSGSADGILNGKRYDIKSTTYKNGRLLSTLKVNPDVDIYILAIVGDLDVDFIGWASKEQLVRKENIINLGHGQGYALTQDELTWF